MGQPGTTGGGAANVVEVTNEEDLGDEVDRTEPLVVRIVGTITGSIDVGSNKTIEGAPGAVLRGHLELNGSVNVIVRNLTIIGYNCQDKDECKRGKDAVSLAGGAHHIWFDHCDISDGSDGNFDIVGGSDYVTISWTKFHYSGQRPGDHQFSSLISSSDQAGDTDAGHMKVTFHHCWWADNISERMPRARFGQIHIFNSLYSAANNNYCIGAGVEAQFLVENSVFSGVKRPSNLKFADQRTILVARGNIAENTSGALEERPGPVFTPPYPYRLEPAEAVKAAVMSGAGPQSHAPLAQRSPRVGRVKATGSVPPPPPASTSMNGTISVEEGALIIEAETMALAASEAAPSHGASDGRAVKLLSNQGTGSIQLELPEGEYLINALVNAPDGEHDAFYVGMDTGPVLRFVPQTHNKWAYGTKFLTVRTSGAGRHTLRFASKWEGQRPGEIGMLIDRFEIVEAARAAPSRWTDGPPPPPIDGRR